MRYVAIFFVRVWGLVRGEGGAIGVSLERGLQKEGINCHGMDSAVVLVASHPKEGVLALP